MLAVTNIYKRYRGALGLEDVTVTIQPGELTVALGPSGGGKTTLLKALALLAPPDSGTWELDGQCRRFPSHDASGDIHPTIGVVFQNLALWPHLTLRQNILLPLQLRALESDTAAYVDELIALFDMQTFLDRLPHQVSGGQRQRAALVRALALRPKYLLLDEITSALDVEQVAMVLQELERLKAAGTGIFLITHILGFARRAADRFVFLSGGRVLESGDIAQLDRPGHERLRSFLAHVSVAS